MRRHAELQDALSSPIPSLGTPFHRDGSIDYAGLRKVVDHTINNGAKALMLTYGDSLFSILTDDELSEVTRTVVKQARGRAKVIAADRVWWTGKAVEWARHCRKLGADILMVLPPDWAQSCTVESVTAHYAAIAKEMPVMMVTGFLAARGQDFRLNLIRSVYDKVPNAVAIKDDVCEEFGRRMTAMVQEQWTVIAGGSKQTHLYLAPFGCRGHLSTLITYKPDIAHRYWNAVTAGDYSTAAGVVRDFDIPMFDALMPCPGSFNAGMHAWAELIGLHARWRRSPYYNMTNEEVDTLAKQLDKIGLLDHSRRKPHLRPTRTGRGRQPT